MNASIQRDKKLWNNESYKIYASMTCNMYDHQCRKSWKIFWRQLPTDQLDFEIGSNLTQDTGDIGFLTRFTVGDRQIQ